MAKIIHTFTATKTLSDVAQIRIEEILRVSQVFNPTIDVRVKYKVKNDLQVFDTIEIRTLYLLVKRGEPDMNETLINELFQPFGSTLGQYFNIRLELAPSN